MLKGPYISLVIGSRASKYETYLYRIMVVHLTFDNISWILCTSCNLTCSKILLNVNVVAHLVVPAGCGSCPPRLAIFGHIFTSHRAGNGLHMNTT